MAAAKPEIRLAVAGLGAIGIKVVEELHAGRVPGFRLAAVSARDRKSAEDRLAQLGVTVPVVSVDALEPLADIVVECAPAALLPNIALPFLRAGKKVVVLSVGAIFNDESLIEVADRHGGQIVVPSGALIGLDAVTAAAEGKVDSVTLVTRKPVRGLLGAPYLEANGIEIEDLSAPMKVFEGTARQAAKGFPSNLNVGAALALGGIGGERTTIEIWADPALTRNTHSITIEADSARFTMTIENIPSENPKTGRITPLSVIATLRKMTAALRVGT